MTLLFKIWNLQRDNKVFIPITDDDKSNTGQHLCNSLILKASERLQTDGSAIVLEADGTLIEDDEVLKLLCKETLILLAKNEKWKPVPDETTLSTCSTVTLRDEQQLSSSSSGLLNDIPSPTPLREIENVSRSVSEDYWNTFEIPWKHISPSIIKQCELGSRNPEHICSVVNITVDSVREIKKYASTKTFKIISKKIVDKYPQQFKDMEGDTVFGDGCHTVFRKLVDRNNYLNRPHKRPRDSLTQDIPPKMRKIMLKSKAGCSNWFPDTCSEYSPETLNDKKILLNTNISDTFTLDDEIISLLNDTYKMQRLYLNNPEAPSIIEIKEEWPVLMQKPVIFWHFNKLMSLDINDLDKMFFAKADKIIKFGIHKKYIETRPDETNMLMVCVEILGKFFQEDTTVLINKLNEDENDEIEDAIKLMAPCVLIITDTGTKMNKYAVYVEKLKISESDELIESFKVLFALYYNFNICYPKQISNTLEFLQRYILKINPDQGSKSKKKSNSKIYSLINKLRNFN